MTTVRPYIYTSPDTATEQRPKGTVLDSADRVRAAVLTGRPRLTEQEAKHQSLFGDDLVEVVEDLDTKDLVAVLTRRRLGELSVKLTDYRNQGGILANAIDKHHLRFDVLHTVLHKAKWGCWGITEQYGIRADYASDVLAVISDENERMTMDGVADGSVLLLTSICDVLPIPRLGLSPVINPATSSAHADERAA